MNRDVLREAYPINFSRNGKSFTFVVIFHLVKQFSASIKIPMLILDTF